MHSLANCTVKRTIKKLILITACCCLNYSVAALDALSALAQFDALSFPNKAIAIAQDDTTQLASSIVHSQATLANSALQALQACEKKRVYLDIKSACEIRAINNTVIKTGKDILASVPQTKHPLFLWRLVSRTATVYLAGSVHVLKQTLYPLPQQYQSAFDVSDHVVVEVDTMSVSAQEMQQKVAKYFLLPETQSLSDILLPEERVRLMSYLERQNTPISAVERLKPSLLATQLAVNRMVAMGYIQEHGMEKHFLSQLGARDILQLETLDDQFQLLANPSMALQRELLMDTLDQMHSIDQVIAELISSWLSGDAQAFQQLTDTLSSDSDAYLDFSKKLLDDRNVGMAEKITAYLRTRGSYFVMVGAAHLIGEKSVISLLKNSKQQSSYSLQQVFSDELIQTPSHNQ